MFTRQLLSAEEQHECCVGKRLENVPKNRYKTILPCTFLCKIYCHKMYT